MGPVGRTSVAVAGSCLTRDNFNSRFNPGHGAHFEVRASNNQASVISLMSPPIEDEFEPTRRMNDYDRWNIRADLSREFLSRLDEVQPELLLLDFQGDVRFGVARLPDGRYFTDHHWKTQHTDFYARAAAADGFTVLRPWDDPDGYFTLWAESLDRLAAYIRRTCPEAQVIVHRGHHAKRIAVPGRPRPVPLNRRRRFRDFDLEAADAWWSRLDEHAISSYGWAQIDLRDLDPPTYRGHPWGPYFSHFTPDYYHRFLAELTKISLRRHLDHDTMQRVELIEAAATEPWQRRLAEEKAVVRTLRARLRAARGRLAETQSPRPRRSVSSWLAR